MVIHSRNFIVSSKNYSFFGLGGKCLSDTDPPQYPPHGKGQSTGIADFTLAVNLTHSAHFT
jgi:hypothetical protein